MSRGRSRVTALPSRPQVKPWYRIAADEHGVLFEHAGSLSRFTGGAATTLLPALLPLLDGTRTVVELTEACGAAIQPAVRNTLDLLTEHGIVMDQSELACNSFPPARATAEFLAASTEAAVSPASLLTHLEDARVTIAGSSNLSLELARLLRLSGVRHVTLKSEPAARELRHCDLLIASPAPGELPVLEELNRSTLRAETPWIPILPHDGALASVGPLYLPGETCCFECFVRRRAANVDYPKEFLTLQKAAASYPTPPVITAALAGLAGSLALRWLALRDPQLPGVLFALEQQETLRLTEHYVYRVPRCSVCSTAEDLAPPLPWFESNDSDVA